ncbi:MAG: polyamine ABC transporter substrate-binding protein [Proteobacteria bacterium]|nr:polyamine ABC transporter substrate-binding protein [Pseudomonadota bacterium]
MRLQHLCAAAAILISAVGGPPARAEEKVLHVFNWSDYVAPDTIGRFSKETGIKVTYDVYDSNEILDAKLMAGKSGFDVVFPTTMPFLARQVQAGVYMLLDKSKLVNFKNVEPSVLKAIAAGDPGNKHAVPYMSAGTGYAFNTKKIAELAPGVPIDSWALIFDPKWSGKLKACGISILDDPIEAFAAAYAYLGIDPASEKKEDLERTAKLIEGLRPNLKYIHSSSYINDLANGDLCVAHGYGGDLVQARDRSREAGKGVAIKIVLPKEGAQANIDVMAIPKDAPHPANAHAFINFMMRPDVVGPITNAVGYANAIVGSDAYVDKARLADPAIFPPKEVRERLFVMPLKSAAHDRLRTRIWTRLKTGQ